ncbi:MAG: FAD-dependent oxidoreductase, partial [Dehalococcoidia bacterium]|nr:FAD-dependent oxidoreductase [Dehalococcoidia bacterium]
MAEPPGRGCADQCRPDVGGDGVGLVKAVVIGGGVAGLAAGYELAKQGHEVSLFEAGPILGGQVRTFEIGGG